MRIAQHRCVRAALVLVTAATLAAPSASARGSAPDGAPPRSIAGAVTAPDGTPLAGVRISVPEASRTTTTTEDGRYAVTQLPTGTYTVSFNAIGYAPVARKLTLTDQDVTINVQMRPSAIELPPVQVTGTPGATSALETPQPLAVVAGADLKNLQAPSLGETLSRLPGLRNLSTGPGVGKPVIRGLSSNRVLILDGGQRLETQQWGDEHGPDISTADAQRIEVIRGPQSVLYGSDALGGVINVIPWETPDAIGRDPFVGDSVSATYTTNGRQPQGAAALEGASGGFGFRAAAAGSTSNEVRTPEYVLWNSGGRTAGGNGAVSYRGAFGSVSGTYAYLNERIELTDEDPLETPFQRIAEHRARATVDLPVGGYRLEATGAMERNRRREFEETGATDVALGLSSRTYLGELHLHHPPAGPLSGVLGTTGYRTTFSKFGVETLIPNTRADNLGVYAFEQAEAGRWRLSVGARFDYRHLDVDTDPDIGVTAQTRTYRSVTGSLGVLYRATEGTALVLNLGRGFRAPSSFDLFANGVHEGTLAFERGNPNLTTEKSLNTDLALRLQGGNVSAEVGGFVNLIQDYIFTVPSGETDSASGFQVYDVAQGDARLVGFEGALEYHPLDLLHLRGTADYTHGVNTTSGEPLPTMPPFRVTYAVRLEGRDWGSIRNPHLEVGGETHARQTRLDPSEREFFGEAFEGAGYQSEAYTLANVGAGVAIPAGTKDVHLEVTLRNALNQTHADFLSRIKTVARNPGRGRSLIVRVTSDF
jgi:outer membrane receptor protein involved in Fe transport